MFSLAVLSVMVGIALDVVTAVAASFWVTSFIGGSNEGGSSMALQQGGLGLVLTMLIISAPPMAAAFFQGTMGQFMAYSQFGSSAGSQPGARGAGSPPAPSTTPGRSEGRPMQDESPRGPSPLLTQQRSEGAPSTTNEVRSPAEARLGVAGQQQSTSNPQFSSPSITAAPVNAPTRPTGGNSGG